jgi:hypothetical protein
MILEEKVTTKWSLYIAMSVDNAIILMQRD